MSHIHWDMFAHYIESEKKNRTEIFAGPLDFILCKLKTYTDYIRSYTQLVIKLILTGNNKLVHTGVNTTKLTSLHIRGGIFFMAFYNFIHLPLKLIHRIINLNMHNRL